MLQDIPSVSARKGILRYPNDRVAMLSELGDEQVDIVESSVGTKRLVVVTDAELARAVLTTASDDMRKGPAMARHALAILGNGLLTSTGDEHRQQRKLLAPKFTPKHIRGYGETMAALTNELLDEWRGGREPTDFADEITTLTMRIAAHTMFGASVSDDEIALISEGMEVCNRWVIDESTSILRTPSWLPTRRRRQLERTLEDIDALLYRLIAEHRAEGGRNDVLSLLLDARDDDGTGMTDELVRDQVMTFFMAGHETIATAMSWTFHVLSAHPDVVETIAEEAEAAFPSGFTQDGLSQLTRTRNTLAEVMRLFPPTYMVGRQARRDVDVGGYRVREGSYVIVNTIGIHRRGDYFADPLVFRPERHEEPAWPRNAYQPFGAGPRVCIGSHFALMEGAIILALLARSIRFTGTRTEIEPEPLITLRPRDGVPFTLAWR